MTVFLLIILYVQIPNHSTHSPILIEYLRAADVHRARHEGEAADGVSGVHARVEEWHELGSVQHAVG